MNIGLTKSLLFFPLSRFPHQNVLGIILGGGAGTRLYPLTKKRAKPAVPLGANYRLIDIPVSNCINSDINKIYCLTQFNSASLNRHLSQAYNSNVGTYNRQGFVEVLAAQQSPVNKDWFQGTADAVRQYLWLFAESKCDEYICTAWITSPSSRSTASAKLTLPSPPSLWTSSERHLLA
jgi:ADP-glucose pyrophosphorylase